MPVPKAQATVTALERLVKVMQEKLPGEIESIQDDGLGLLTPCMSDYFMPGGHITEQILHAPIAVIVTQSAPSYRFVLPVLHGCVVCLLLSTAACSTRRTILKALTITLM